MPMEYFEQRERALLGDRFDVLYAAPQETAERGVTVSALRSSPEQFAAKADFPLEASPFCKAAFVVHQPDDLKFRPGRHPYHHAGVFYSQEPSASSAAPLLGVQPGMRVLDMCAAPGGKSSQLAAALQGRGVLVSNEYVAARADILKSNLERMGVPNAVVLNEAPARIADALPEFFDRVLVDAPCSGEGMFRKEPVARQQHCEALVKQCAELGAEILDCAAAVLAPGGQLVYSTCTFAPEEDEGQVAAFLQRHPEFTLADALGNVDYTFGSEGEANRTGGLPLDVSKVRRIWPCQGGEGHFMARLVKAGTPRTLPAAGEYTPEELLWLDAAAAAGKKGKGKGGKPAREQDARAARRADSRACRDAVQGGRSRSRDAGVRELYIVEGDSAMGAVKSSRDSEYQAIMPIRGKILNCLKADYARIFKSDVIVDLIKVMGCGVELGGKHNKELATFNLDNLRFNKIVICTDADVDGYQIRTLVLTMLYRLTPTLINKGYVYIAESPLYEITTKDRTYFAYTESEKAAFLQKIGDKKYTIQRSKGLGENDPEMMWLTTMNPESRRLIKVMPTDVVQTAQVFDILLGDNLAGRKEHIAQHGAEYLDDLDVS